MKQKDKWNEQMENSIREEEQKQNATLKAPS